MSYEKLFTRIGWTAILAALLVPGLLGWAGAFSPGPANASVATQLQNARDLKANCQLLANNSSGDQRARARNCVTDQDRIITLLTTTQGTPSPSPSSPTTPPTATPTITTSPTTPAPPRTNNCAPLPSACGFPDSSNTGVPAGTVLVAAGTATITTPNVVIDGKDLGCVTVEAVNVTIRNSRISGQCYFVVRANSSGLVIQDSEISCENSTGTGIGGRGFVAQRVEFTGCENGLSMDADATVSDSYIHAMYIANGGHTDGIQIYSGADNIWILHNTIFNENNGGTSAIIGDNNNMTNINIQGNLLAGGAYTLYCATRNSGPVTNNRISKLYKPQGGQYGPWVNCGLQQPHTGNVWDDNGSALPL